MARVFFVIALLGVPPESGRPPAAVVLNQAATDPAPTPVPGPEASMLIANPESANLLARARTEILSGRLNQGEATLYQLADREDGSAAAYHHLATHSLLKVLLFDRQSDYSQFFERSDSLREILSDQDRSRDRRFLTGEADFQRALAWAKKGSYVRAAMAGVSAYRILSRIVEVDPQYLEAYKSLGILHTLLGTLPSRYRRILSVFGFETDVDVGLDQLVVAAEETAYGRPESLVLMSILDSFNLPTRVKAAEALRDLYDEYEESPLFALVLVDALLRKRGVVEAEAVLQETLARSATNPDVIHIEYLQAFLADVRFKQERWEEAARGYAAFREAYGGSALKSVSALRQGLSLEMAGRRSDAEAVYRSLVAGRDFDSEEASARGARLRLATPMGEAAMTLLRARCAYDRSDVARADSLLSRLESSELEGVAALSGEISYRRARLLDETGQDDEAIPHYQAAIERPGDAAAKWAPYGLYYLGRIHEEAGRAQEARAAYRRVVDYKGDYDYRGTNERLALFALERVGG
jgi:tetratricopeptide (TPR) repeat protein